MQLRNSTEFGENLDTNRLMEDETPRQPFSFRENTLITDHMESEVADNNTNNNNNK